MKALRPPRPAVRRGPPARSGRAGADAAPTRLDRPAWSWSGRRRSRGHRAIAARVIAAGLVLVGTVLVGLVLVGAVLVVVPVVLVIVPVVVRLIRLDRAAGSAPRLDIGMRRRPIVRSPRAMSPEEDDQRRDDEQQGHDLRCRDTEERP